LKKQLQLKSTLVQVKVEELDADNVQEVKEKNVNILRDKTFNSELGLLLNTINSNEKTSDTRPTGPAEHEIDYNLKNAALLEIEKTIYQLKEFHESGRGQSGFNPFDLDINVYDDIEDTNDYIIAGMNQAGFPLFLLMKFDLEDNAFRVDINTAGGNLTSDAFFSMNDGLFTRLKAEQKGIFLSTGDIREDIFLSKKFGTVIEKKSDSDGIYLIRLSDLCREPFSGTAYRNRLSGFDEVISPILAIKTSEMDRTEEDSIFSRLQHYASIPLAVYMMNNTMKTGFSGLNYRATLLMVNLFALASENTNRKIVTLKLTDYSDKKDQFIYSYMISKIRKILKMNSLLIRISVSLSVLVCSESELEQVKLITGQINIDQPRINVESINYNESPHDNQFARLFL